MQNRFLNSQAIDFRPVQNGATAADPSGSHIANAGGMLGNAIMQYAKDKKEREEKKAKEEAAARFILQSGAGKDMGIVDEKSAMQAVKGVGVDNIQNFIQLQQKQKQIEQQDQQMKIASRQLGMTYSAKMAEVQEREQKANAAAEFLKRIGNHKNPDTHEVQGDAFGNRSTGVTVTPGASRSPTQREGAQIASQIPGLDPEWAMGAIKSLPEDPKGDSRIGKVIQIDDNTKAVYTSENAIQVIKANGEAEELKAGSERDLTRNGKTIKAVWDGRKFKEKGSGLDVDLEETDALGRRTKRNNPDVWGGGVGGPSQPSSPITPAVNIGRFRVTTQ